MTLGIRKRNRTSTSLFVGSLLEGINLQGASATELVWGGVRVLPGENVEVLLLVDKFGVP